MPSEFLTEKDLKEVFWKSYYNTLKVKSYQFECKIREGNADLVTLEMFQEEYQINSFEFKISNFSKALLQAKANLEYVNRSWIVLPYSTAASAVERNQQELKELKHIGVIGVEAGGRYHYLQKIKFSNPAAKLSSPIIKLIRGPE